jgi:hypothetical protein
MRKKDIFSNPITKIKADTARFNACAEKWEIDTRET